MSELIERIEKANKAKATEAYYNLVDSMLKLIPSQLWVNSHTLSVNLEQFFKEHREKIIEHYAKENNAKFYQQAESLFALLQERTDDN
jgi:hypothetical protein